MRTNNPSDRDNLVKGIRFIFIVPLFLFVNISCYEQFITTPENEITNPTAQDDTHKFIDGRGRITVYHGVNVANYAKTSPTFISWHTEEDFARLQSWGFNLVRYLMFWEAVEPQPGVINWDYLTESAERIQWLYSLGIDVIIDFHQDLYSRKFTGNGIPEWAVRDSGKAFTPQASWSHNYYQPAVTEAFDNFWESDTLQNAYITALRQVCETFMHYPNVIGVDLFNEPFPGSIENFEATALTTFYEKIQSMWIENGYTFRMFFQPMLFTSNGATTKLQFAPTVPAAYSPHYYDALSEMTWEYGSANTTTLRKAVQYKVEEAQAFGIPLIFGEYGIDPRIFGYSTYITDFIDECDKFCVSRLYWGYDMDIHNDFAFLDQNKEPKENFSYLVCVGARKINGRKPVISKTANSFQLEYDALFTDAPTEIFIPATLQNVQIRINDVPYTHSGTMLTYVNDQNEKQTILITWQE